MYYDLYKEYIYIYIYIYIYLYSRYTAVYTKSIMNISNKVLLIKYYYIKNVLYIYT